MEVVRDMIDKAILRVMTDRILATDFPAPGGGVFRWDGICLSASCARAKA